MSDAPLAIVLAAGLSTRMRSKTPKVLHPIAGRPLLAYVLETLRSVRARPLVVLAKESEAARDLLDGQTRVVIQDPPRGTGDAVRVALVKANGDEGLAYIVYGDTPQLRAETLAGLGALVRDGATLAILAGAGVTFRDAGSCQVDADVQIAPDVLVEQGTILEGKTRIGAGSRIGPYAVMRDTIVGERCRVEKSTLEGATLEDDVRIGPYSHLRPGAYLERGVVIGNFGEVKNARLRTGTKMHHFSYVGDADIGARVNIGAGTITLNYDGVRKNRTTVGDDAFIGSDTLLRAPVTVGKGATTGAGAVVTKDVPEGMVAVGMPARAIKKADRRKKAGQ